MNTRILCLGKSRGLGRLGDRRGIALISVLAVLILLTVLVVAFLMRAEVARTSSANYRATTGTRLLADTVLNLVQAEINDATTYGSSTGNSGTAPFTWASQPGAIRVYDSTGALQKIYKLYSAPSLTTSTVANVLDASGNTTEITGTGTTGWTNPARWVDLNAPVTVSDPSSPSSSFDIYPILDNRDPTGLAAASPIKQPVQMPGFFVNQIGTSTFPTSNASVTGPGNWNQPYMPVQWLYTLANGQIVAPTGGTGNTATFTAPNAPTAANPIVGRIAFWTDDDTCKVNINTAGGSVSFRADPNSNGILVSDGGILLSTAYDSTGNAWAPAPWDTPRFAGSWEDVKLFSEDQPVQGEYQRYPGHPATTILYYILRSLAVSPDGTAGFTMPEILTDPSNGLNPYGMSYTSGKTATTQDSSTGGNLSWPFTSSLFGIMPRYNDNGGSQSGIANTTATNPPTAITPRRNRLYTSLGELLYSTYSTGSTPPIRSRNGKLTTGSPQTPTSPYFTRQQIETGKFFLTTHSRSPETTLFGTPRVAMWPIPDTAGTSSQGTQMAITTFDQLIKFCATTSSGTNTYYFKRYDSANATNDYSNEARNQAVYGYLQDLTAGNIPGYGGNFLSKYGSSNISSIANERDQILTEIVDYIRCTNQNEHTWNSAANPIPAGKATYAPKGEIIPLQITKGGYTTQGLGRLLTLSEIGLHVICTADGTNNLVGVNAGNSNTGYVSTANTSTSVAYNVPVITAVSTTIPVSPVIGSASDPAYVSNLPVQQFLRDTANNIVDMFGVTVNAGNASTCTPFPANKTLTTFVNNPTSGNYGGTLTALQPGQKQLQAMLIFEPASPMLGYDSMVTQGGQGPDVNILVTNIQNIAIGGLNPFPSQNSSSTSAGPPTSMGTVT